MAGGLGLARELSDAGKRVFLDMKLLDIENTVERATRNAATCGATFLTVHAHDAKTLRAALAGSAGTDLEILGVTVLTNLEAADIREQGFEATPADLVGRRAALARDAGCDGIVASGLEAERVRAARWCRRRPSPCGRPAGGDCLRCRLSRRRPADRRGDRSRRGGRGLRAAYRGRACATREGSGSLSDNEQQSQPEENHAQGLCHRPR